MNVRLLTTVATLPVAPLVCHAEVFLTVEQAQQLIFPGEKLVGVSCQLTDLQRRQIEEASGTKVKERQLRAWTTAAGGVFFLDTTTGRRERITYACGITAGGQVKQVEVLEYREAHGQEVRRAAWRRQFEGLTATSRVSLGRDIRNISGATFSCAGITAGVRRLLHTHAVVFATPNAPAPTRLIS